MEPKGGAVMKLRVYPGDGSERRGLGFLDAGAVPAASTTCTRDARRGGTKRPWRDCYLSGAFAGGDTGSTGVDRLYLLPGMIPPLSGRFSGANDNVDTMKGERLAA